MLVAFANLATLATLAAAAAATARAIVYHRALPELPAPSPSSLAVTHRLPCFRVASRVAGDGAALPVRTHRLVTALLPPHRRRGARYGNNYVRPGTTLARGAGLLCFWTIAKEKTDPKSHS